MKKFRTLERGDYEIAAGIVMLIVVLVVGGIWAAAKNNHREHLVACVVQDKDRTRGSDGKSDMRVYTENCGVLRVEDSLFAGQFDSSDIYSRIKVGKTYDFTTQGWRNGLFSMFPNIIEMQEVSP